MKILIALLIAAGSALSAAAQDTKGRERRPPSATGSTGGKTTSGGTSGGSGSARSGGDRSAADRPTSARGDSNGASARRRVPTAQRPDARTIDGLRGRAGEPERWTTDPTRGEPLGRAVPRKPLPPRDGTVIIDDFHGVDRHRGEREWGRRYWHEYRGYRYCHYVDHYGDDWYIWYFGDDYYSTRYHGGRWWRYDGRHSRWCYLHGGRWYYQEGPRVYVYEHERDEYVASSEGPDEVEPSRVSAGLNLGHFSAARGGIGEVINENGTFLEFDGRGVSGAAVGAEVHVGVGKYAEAGLGAGYFTATLPTRYQGYVREDDSEIRQELSVSNLPVSAVVRIMPFGRDQRFQPYVGGGVQLNTWRYQEKGQFVDFNDPDNAIYKETYRADGLAAGPVAVAGLRIPINERLAFNGEYRRQWAKGKLPADQGFAGDHLNLGGSTLQAGMSVNIK